MFFFDGRFFHLVKKALSYVRLKLDLSITLNAKLIFFLMIFHTNCSAGILHDMIAISDYNGLQRHCNQGAWLSERDESGYTALHLAIINNDIKAVNILLSAGANINTITEDGLHPMHLASMFNLHELIILLHSNNEGAVINIQTEDSLWNTPLHLVNSQETWNLLIHLGADNFIQNSFEEFPFPPQFKNMNQ